MMKSLLAAVVVLALGCSAQTPVPCKSPAQWEGRILQMDRTKEYGLYGKITYDESNARFRIIEMDRTKEYGLYGKITYDESNERFRIIEEMEVGKDKEYYDTLYLHNINRQYTLNLKTRKCNVTDLTRPFRGFGVPPFAKFVFEAEVGAAGIPGETVTVQTFDGEFRDGARFVSTVTFPDCVPVNFGFYTNETGFATSDFFDLNLGISDPTVFIPPRECTM